MKILLLLLTLTATIHAGYTWTGYFVYPNSGQQITAVEATYFVPSFKPSRGAAYIWPGIGGLTSFQQCGTLCNVDRKGNSINYTWAYELSDAHRAYWPFLMAGNTYDTTFSASGQWVTARVEVTGQYHVVFTMISGNRTWIYEVDDSLFTGATGEWLYEVPSGKPVLAAPLQWTNCKYQVNGQPTWYVIDQPCPYAATGPWHDTSGTYGTDGLQPNGSFNMFPKP